MPQNPPSNALDPDLDGFSIEEFDESSGSPPPKASEDIAFDDILDEPPAPPIGAPVGSSARLPAAPPLPAGPQPRAPGAARAETPPSLNTGLFDVLEGVDEGSGSQALELGSEPGTEDEPGKTRVLLAGPASMLYAVELEAAGFAVTPVESGIEALSVLDTVLPELVVTSLDLGDLSGLELMKTAQSAHPGLRFVLVDDPSFPKQIVAALGEGAVAFVPAGSPASRLVDTLKNVAAGKPQGTRAPAPPAQAAPAAGVPAKPKPRTLPPHPTSSPGGGPARQTGAPGAPRFPTIPAYGSPLPGTAKPAGTGNPVLDGLAARPTAARPGTPPAGVVPPKPAAINAAGARPAPAPAANPFASRPSTPPTGTSADWPVMQMPPPDDEDPLLGTGTDLDAEDQLAAMEDGLAAMERELAAVEQRLAAPMATSAPPADRTPAPVLAASTEEVGALRQKLATAEAEARQWKTKAEATEKAAALSTQQLVSARMEAQAAQQQLAATAQQLVAMRMELQSVRQQSEDTSQLQDRISQLEGELALVRAQATASDGEMAAFKAALDSALADRAAAQAQIVEAEGRAMEQEEARAQAEMALKEALAAPRAGGASPAEIKEAVDKALGEVKRLIEAVSPFMWGLEQAAVYVENTGAGAEKEAHARQLKLLFKVLTRLKDRAEGK